MKEYTRKQLAEIGKVRDYLNREFKEYNKGKDFSDSQVSKVYEAMGRSFDSKGEYDALVGQTLGFEGNINFRLRSFKKVSEKDLEGLVGKKDRKANTKFDSYGQIITSVIFISLVCVGIFSLAKLTGYNVLTLFQKVDFSIATIIFVAGLFLFGFYFYLRGGEKNGRR